MTVPERLSALHESVWKKRTLMCVVPTADFHQSEYVGNISKRESSLQGSQDQREQP